MSQQTEKRMTLEHSASTLARREAFRLSAYLQISGLIKVFCRCGCSCCCRTFSRKKAGHRKRSAGRWGPTFSVYLLVQIPGWPDCGPLWEHHDCSDRGCSRDLWQRELPDCAKVAKPHLFGANASWGGSSHGSRPGPSFTWWTPYLHTSGVG